MIIQKLVPQFEDGVEVLELNILREDDGTFSINAKCVVTHPEMLLTREMDLPGKDT